jgi:hypothetical protein
VGVFVLEFFQVLLVPPVFWRLLVLGQLIVVSVLGSLRLRFERFLLSYREVLPVLAH